MFPGSSREIDDYGRGRPASVSFVDAPEVIGMGESPAAALRAKRGSSIRVATDLVRDGLADAVVSAGSTGATMAAAVFRLGRIEGIDRPALAAHLVTATGPIMILDVGANVDSDATNLVHFAVMGSHLRGARAEGAAPPHRPPEHRRGGGEGQRAGARGPRAHARRGPQFCRQRRGQRHGRPRGRRGDLRRVRGQRGHQVLRGADQLHLPLAPDGPAAGTRSRRWRCWRSSRASTA